MVCITICFCRFWSIDSYRRVSDECQLVRALEFFTSRFSFDFGWRRSSWRGSRFQLFFIWLPSLANTCHVGTWTPKQILCLTQSSTCHPPCSLWHFLWEGSEFLRTGWPRHQNKFLNADASGEAIWLCCKWTCFHSAGVYSCNIVQAWAPVVQERASLVQACACNRRTTVL